MEFVDRPVRVTVPATSANLGPGFDCLALALSWREELSAELTGSTLQVDVAGPAAAEVPRDESHLVVQAMDLGFAALGTARPRGLRLACTTAVPHGRGLGSSAAAIIGGLALARALVSDGQARLPDAGLLRIAADAEGHPDNVAAALFGGLVVSGRLAAEEGASAAGAYFAHRIPVDPAVRAVVYIPEFQVPTSVARAALPESVPHGDAASTVGRAALLVSALRDSPDLLVTATRDLLHQDYRRAAMPQTLDLVHELRGRGHAAVVSGAGPSVLVLTVGADAELLDSCPTGWAVRALEVDPDGVRIA